MDELALKAAVLRAKTSTCRQACLIGERSAVEAETNRTRIAPRPAMRSSRPWRRSRPTTSSGTGFAALSTEAPSPATSAEMLQKTARLVEALKVRAGILATQMEPMRCRLAKTDIAHLRSIIEEAEDLGVQAELIEAVAIAQSSAKFRLAQAITSPTTKAEAVDSGPADG